MTSRGQRIICASLFALISCTRESPATLPEPPDVAAPAPPPAQLSRIAAPIEYDFSAVLRLVDSIVPKRFGSMDSVKQMGEDGRRHYAWQATRGPFTAFADGNLLHLKTTLEYTARGFYKPPLAPTIGAGCGKGSERPRLFVELATPISLTPDYHLASKARIVTVAAASGEPRDHCDVSILHKDVTPQVVEAAQHGLESQLAAIDKKISGVSLKSHMTEWWGLLSRPIRLTDGVWLELAPQKVALGKVHGQSKTLVVPVALEARPVVLTMPTEPSADTLPLPRLGKDTSRASAFHLILDGLIDYGAASQQLNAAFSGKAITASGHTIRLSEVTVVPQAKGKLAVSVKFSGDAEGAVQLLGTPRLDHAHDEVVVPDLDFDLRTSSSILQTYAWLKSEDVRGELRKRARVSTKPALDKGRALLTLGLNRKLGDALTLSGVVDSVSARSLFITRDGIVVRAEATGLVGLAVKQR